MSFALPDDSAPARPEKISATPGWHGRIDDGTIALSSAVICRRRRERNTGQCRLIGRPPAWEIERLEYVFDAILQFGQTEDTDVGTSLLHVFDNRCYAVVRAEGHDVFAAPDFLIEVGKEVSQVFSRRTRTS